MSAMDVVEEPRRSVTAQSPKWWYITPLIFTLMPLIRIGFRHNPSLRNKLYGAAIAAGLVHGTYLITSSTSQAPREVFLTPQHIHSLSSAKPVAAGKAAGGGRQAGGKVGGGHDDEKELK